MENSSDNKWGEFLMSNYLVTDTDLTSVANAIRTKGGTSASLSFPSGFIDAINAISGGGGSLPSFMSKLDSGVIEPESNITSNYQVSHNLGEMPAGILVWTDEGELAGDGDTSLRCMLMIRDKIYNSSNAGRYSVVYLYRASQGPVAYAEYGTNLGIRGWWNSPYDYFTIYVAGETGKLLAGRKYYWIAWA